MFHMFGNKEKGKLNRLKVGQKVRVKQRLVDWEVKHSPDMCAIGPGTPNAWFKEDSVPKVYSWMHAQLTGKLPEGVITHYGARDNDRGIERKCVYVSLTFKTGAGKIVFGTYVNEKDLTILRKK